MHHSLKYKTDGRHGSVLRSLAPAPRSSQAPARLSSRGASSELSRLGARVISAVTHLVLNNSIGVGRREAIFLAVTKAGSRAASRAVRVGAPPLSSYTPDYRDNAAF
ncbi:hypothetical protein EVAR_36148_1 [Eumeta japonica]|uniref:Uncharacterized protein n=1 Tax=Eumeta variegata TaxID=151549 RepID=A0A4C1X181_EUMVA|nr:hypothetical protein EVAR_36148_1 [Eumeta japonica]